MFRPTLIQNDYINTYLKDLAGAVPGYKERGVNSCTRSDLQLDFPLRETH